MRQPCCASPRGWWAWFRRRTRRSALVVVPSFGPVAGVGQNGVGELGRVGRHGVDDGEEVEAGEQPLGRGAVRGQHERVVVEDDERLQAGHAVDREAGVRGDLGAPEAAHLLARGVVAGGAVSGQELRRAADVAHAPDVRFLRQDEQRLRGVGAGERDSDVGQRADDRASRRRAEVGEAGDRGEGLAGFGLRGLQDGDGLVERGLRLGREEGAAGGGVVVPSMVSASALTTAASSPGFGWIQASAKSLISPQSALTLTRRALPRTTASLARSE